MLDETNDQVSFPYIIEKGERLAAEPMAPVGFRKHVLETREPLLFDAITAELLAEYGQPEVLVGERPKSSVWVPLVVSGRATGVISLQNLERERAFSEVDLRLLDDARRQPERRARERPAVRGDASAERRARAHQRRAAQPRREPRDARDVRARRRPAPGDLRRAGRRHRRARPGDRQASVPVLDRARRPLPGRRGRASAVSVATS